MTSCGVTVTDGGVVSCEMMVTDGVMSCGVLVCWLRMVGAVSCDVMVTDGVLCPVVWWLQMLVWCPVK